MSYRTRRSRDPVSRKPSSALDSGQSLRDFRNDELGARTQNIALVIIPLALFLHGLDLSQPPNVSFFSREPGRKKR